jgi:hypothetical protein
MIICICIYIHIYIYIYIYIYTHIHREREYTVQERKVSREQFGTAANAACHRFVSPVLQCVIKKIKLSHHTPWRRFGGEEIQLLLILYLDTRWGEWSASRLVRALAPGKGPPGTHCTGGWLGPRTGLDTEDRGKILSPLPGIEAQSPGRPVRS